METTVIKATLFSSLTGFLNATLYILAISGDAIEFPAALIFASVGAFAVFLVVVFWGIPMHYLLRRLNKTSIRWYVLVGIIPSLIIPVDYYMGGNYSDLVLQTLYFTYVAIVAAVVFRANVRELYA